MNEIERTPVQKQIMPAERISEVTEYYFSVKLKEVAAMNARGENVINLGIGSPDLPPAEDVVEALCGCAQCPDSHGYQPYVGLPELREAFADFYKRKFGVALNPDSEILPLMGSKEGIMHISMAFVNPGDSVLVPNPGYPTYSSVSKLVGADIIYYPLKEENNWLPDFDALEKQHSIGKINLNKVKLMWCNYPNMPTGATADSAVYKRFVEFGKKYGIVICHDNPYSFIRNDKPVSILAVPGAMETCIELNSMSKTFDMPGWRIGMAASNPQFISWILRVKSNMDSGMFKGLQMAAIKALAAPDSWYAKINELYNERSILAQKVLEAAGCEVRLGQQGLFLWGKVKSPSPATSCNKAECSGSNSTSTSSSNSNNSSNSASSSNSNSSSNSTSRCAAEVLCDKILYGCKVFVTPGSVFGTEGNSYVRISLCATKEVLKAALERIKKGI